MLASTSSSRASQNSSSSDTLVFWPAIVTEYFVPKVRVMVNYPLWRHLGFVGHEDHITHLERSRPPDRSPMTPGMRGVPRTCRGALASVAARQGLRRSRLKTGPLFLIRGSKRYMTSTAIKRRTLSISVSSRRRLLAAITQCPAACCPLAFAEHCPFK